MDVIIPIPLVWVLWSEEGTCVPLCIYFIIVQNTFFYVFMINIVRKLIV